MLQRFQPRRLNHDGWTRKAACSALAASALLVAVPASAYDSLAVPCEIDPYFCETAPIGFEGTDALPIEWSFDTGWVPQGSPLQVHLAASIWASTRISLNGQLVTAWPEALTLTTPGNPLGGDISYHYGVEVVADASVNISVFGQSFGWTGNIPYVPQIDLQVEAQSEFDAWGFAPGASVSSTSDLQKIAQVGLGSLIGSSIPGIDGGFELDVAVELEATYVNDRIVLATVDGLTVSGGEILAEDGETSTPLPDGPSIELDARAEGHVDYVGTLHLVPSIYVTLLGQSWSIPVADIPVAFPTTTVDWVFAPVRVHVPLPDVTVATREIDFGDVVVGDSVEQAIPIGNHGEAAAYVLVASNDMFVFVPPEAPIELGPSAVAKATVRFVPPYEGTFETTVHVASNDPGEPMVAVLVRGTAHALSVGVVAAPLGDLASDTGGCGCKVAGAEAPARDGAAAMIGLAIVGLVAGRRRAAKRSIIA